MPEPGSTQESPASGKQEPRVDIVIPVLNEAHVLAKSVATVRGFLNSAVTWQWRIVIVDNGSTDGTDDVGRQLTREYPDVQFVQLPQRGPSAARFRSTELSVVQWGQRTVAFSGSGMGTCLNLVVSSIIIADNSRGRMAA